MVASPVIRDGDVGPVVVTESPTDSMRSGTLRGWLVIGAGEFAAMLLAVGAALRLTGWVLRPVRVLDATTHDIATGRLKSRVAPSGGPPELRRLARSFNEMADHVEDVLEQQRAFVADASRTNCATRSPPSCCASNCSPQTPAQGNEEIASVQTEGKRLARVLDDLLDLALAEHSQADLKVTDIGAPAAERVAAWRPTAEAKGVRLVGDCPPTTGWADPVSLSSALDAVIHNAVKFTPRDETVRVGVSSTGDAASVVVTNGPGLDRRGARARATVSAQRPAPEHQGLRPGPVHLPGAARGGRRLDFLRPLTQPHGLEVTVTVPRTGDGGRAAPATA
ncbi:HAMP domain-containing sensor histidine kinase [Streptomyces violaceorubidus]